MLQKGKAVVLRRGEGVDQQPAYQVEREQGEWRKDAQNISEPRVHASALLGVAIRRRAIKALAQLSVPLVSQSVQRLAGALPSVFVNHRTSI